MPAYAENLLSPRTLKGSESLGNGVDMADCGRPRPGSLGNVAAEHLATGPGAEGGRVTRLGHLRHIGSVQRQRSESHAGAKSVDPSRPGEECAPPRVRAGAMPAGAF